MILDQYNLQDLLHTCAQLLRQKPRGALASKQGHKFEPVLVEAIEEAIVELGISNISERGVELVSGQRFPDILIHTEHATLSRRDTIIGTEELTLGVEVKTSKQGWTTLGGSIFESTRVEGVECIYLFFANFSDPEQPEFRFCDHELCISDVVITHKPRYAIDMDATQTLFDKAQVSYDEIRNASNPFAKVRKYMKEKSGKNTELWWIEPTNEDSVEQQGPQAFRMWGDLSKGEQTELIETMYALFPNLVSKSQDKYVQPALYLVSRQGVVCRSLRDPFSGGGKADIHTFKAPKYLQHIATTEHLERIADRLIALDVEVLQEYWGLEFDELLRIRLWKSLLIKELENNSEVTSVPGLLDYMSAMIQEI
ncbi:hypothetical protein [Vibrio sp. SCSIO 43136]|uniref:hypothetical protein n=1 Tax=Vibrio sp. SCSIO 43136 TaxID=2819101 RepID=UPI0020765089|nr:hypothetical protein [Vibrio sp. SCSIO 43136]USD64529.1 hypothetical protein J4N39_10500 [Vibrio sp. SCSIO 43136]